MSKKNLSPESLMMSFGYTPEWSEGAIKCPIYQTSTFVFKTAEEGKSFFELAYGIRELAEGEKAPGLIYSRLNNPDIEILEHRIALWDKADDCASFESGMSAISTVLLEYLRPGDVVLFSSPVYGGTDHFIKHILTGFNIGYEEFFPWDTQEDILQKLALKGILSQVKMVYAETPANPTNALFDITMLVDLAKKLSTPEIRVKVAVDNTYMGPLWQKPLELGADFSLYSATKYIGGHSDVIAGAVCGKKDDMIRIKTLRTFLGNMAGPWTAWLLMRSLETLKIRMEQQALNAGFVADYLKSHPKVTKVNYLGHLTEQDGKSYEIFKKQYSSAGAMLSFEVVNGEKGAFAFLNALKLCKFRIN
jgi:methionine-gamma-lyase